MKSFFRIFFQTIFIPFCSVPMTSAQVPSGNLYVYFGTSSNGPGKGFSLSVFDPVSGKLTTPEFIMEAASPSFFVIDKTGDHLYAASEINSFKDQASGALNAYSIERSSGKLTLLNQQPSGGSGPCHVSLDGTEKYLFAANYNGGSLSVHSINKDGSLAELSDFIQHSGSSVNPERQNASHAHCIKADPSNNFILATDLGEDKLYIYKFDKEKGKLGPNLPAYITTSPGAGPRHFTFHPNRKWLYLLNELSSSITVFEWNITNGQLKELQTMGTLPENFHEKNTAAEIAVHPNGRFLYSTNRGHNSIAVFSIDQESGKIAFVERISSQGKNPRNFAVDPSGRWMIVTNHSSNNAVVFKINQETGQLILTGNPVHVPDPFCVQFMKFK